MYQVIYLLQKTPEELKYKKSIDWQQTALTLDLPFAYENVPTLSWSRL